MSDTEDSATSCGRENRFEKLRAEFLASESTIYCTSYFYFAVGAQAVANAWLNKFDSSMSSVLLAAAAVSVWIGMGLRRLNPNARTGAAIISIFSVALDWTSVVFHGYFLYHLFSSNGSLIFSETYRRAVRHTPHTSPTIRWLPILVTAIFVFLVGSNVVDLIEFQFGPSASEMLIFRSDVA